MEIYLRSRHHVDLVAYTVHGQAAQVSGHYQMVDGPPMRPVKDVDIVVHGATRVARWPKRPAFAVVDWAHGSPMPGCPNCSNP
jgi:hypothetical protein